MARASSSFDCLVLEARRRGIVVDSLGARNYLALHAHGRTARLFGTLTDRTSHLAVTLADDKWASKTLLSRHGLPTPPGYAVTCEDDALQAWRALGGEVVVKPRKGCQAKGVSTGLTDSAQVVAAYRRARRWSSAVLVERHCPGRDYRLTVVDSRMVAAVERRPAQVVGDGMRSIGELIDELNQDPRRGEGDTLPLSRVPLNVRLEEFLARSYWTLRCVPELGQTVVLSPLGSVSQGSVSLDRTDAAHPELARLAVEAVQLIGLDIAGVDLIAKDIALPLAQSAACLIEVNASPGLRAHLFPQEGQPRDVAKDILDYLFPESCEDEADANGATHDAAAATSLSEGRWAL